MTTKKTNVIVMKDNREVDFGQRGKLKKVIDITGEGSDRTVNISVDCTNGDTHVMSFGVNDPLLFEYAAHGVSQKITDSITKADDEEDVSFGVANQIKQLLSGKWTSRNTDGMVRGFSDLLEAIRRIKGLEENSPELEALKVNLATKSEEDLKTIKFNSGVKAILATITSEKAAERAKKLATESNDSSASLDELLV